MSACGLFHIAYPSAPDLLRAELRSVYNQLCHDDMPMVRRSAALNLGKFAATVEAMYLKSDIMTFFRDLTQDGTCLRPFISNLTAGASSNHFVGRRKGGGKGVIHRWSLFNTCIRITHVLSLHGDYSKHSRLTC